MCPAHFSLVVKNKLNEKFTNRWIARKYDFVVWPAHSLDNTKFFLEEILKDIYKDKPITSHVTTDYCDLYINNFRYYNSKPIIASQ